MLRSARTHEHLIYTFVQNQVSGMGLSLATVVNVARVWTFDVAPSASTAGTTADKCQIASHRVVFSAWWRILFGGLFLANNLRIFRVARVLGANLHERYEDKSGHNQR